MSPNFRTKLQLGYLTDGKWRNVMEERVGRSAYRLNVPTHWRMHPVISVDQLEPAPSDPFERYTHDTEGVRVTDRKPSRILQQRTHDQHTQYR
ncbi:hypothetical protein CEP54_008910 [Fusarium duplospermum]|uniref:Uncharacterized protein n=1 Tax=Fusarium duplospermum TaxID=1325734 RepID=A0A428PTE1_9HYPO|nr:hypothetical protein CEP54_008910 [Fusarium duplospermum]